jgi:hypothetical protein
VPTLVLLLPLDGEKLEGVKPAFCHAVLAFL